jgi:hypothetical protein
VKHSKFITAKLEKVWDFLEDNSRKGPEPMGSVPRYGLLLLLCAVFGFIAWGISELMDTKRFVDPSGVDIAGEWEFYNGASPKCRGAGASAEMPCLIADFKKAWPEKVKVPEPLADQIKGKLADEFWYRRKVILPEHIRNSSESISLSLGSVKGPHTIWVNGNYLGSGSDLSLGNYILPKEFLVKSDPVLVVRVKKYDTLFPGIVHNLKMQIGATRFLERQDEWRDFIRIAKPMIGLVVKLSIFFIFAALFIAMPLRREYLYFSFFCFFSAASAFCDWSLNPFYENYYLRQAVSFGVRMATYAVIPILLVEFFRFQKILFKAFVSYGLYFCAAFLLALFLVKPEKITLLYEMFYGAAPYFIYLPAAIVSFALGAFLFFRIRVIHRVVPAWVLSLCFLAIFLANAPLARSRLSFTNSFLFFEFLDLIVFFAMAFVMGGEFKSLSHLFLRSKKLLPSIVSRLNVEGKDQAIFNFPAITMVVDVVGYTKTLATIEKDQLDQYNNKIKDRLQKAISFHQGEKISDTGDGGVFVWQYNKPDEMAKKLELALSAAYGLADASVRGDVQYRIGIAAGEIKCHLNYPNYSFLGDPINIAARLQSVAEVGVILVSENISFLGCDSLELTDYIIKGAKFRARRIHSNFKLAA